MGAYKWCPRCNENSVVRKAEPRKIDGLIKRIEYCTNKGCGYKLDLDPHIPSAKKVKQAMEVNQGQMSFNF